VEGSFSHAGDDFRWRQSKHTGETLRKQFLFRQCPQANNGILVGDCEVLDTAETENHLELKKEVDERKLHRMAKVHNFLGM
jgi:hypothetical protein